MVDEVVTLTANPSLDRTLALDAALAVGQVQRLTAVTEQAGGKGVNVARVVRAGGRTAVAVAPAVDALYRHLVAQPPAVALVADSLPDGHRVRINTAVTEPDGTTTKLNECGALLDAAQRGRVEGHLAEAAAGASWVVLSGSLPPGAPGRWYADLSEAVAGLGCRVAVDTSGLPLRCVVAELPNSRIDLLKPNTEELAELTGGDPARLERRAADGDVTMVVSAARGLVERGIANVLVTLGGSGAVLVNAEGAWFAASPRIAVRSTVGAGDSALAGFLLADLQGADPQACLASAVGYGSAAAALPSTTLPGPGDVAGLDKVQVVRVG